MKRTKFTTIYHAPRLKLGLTCNEYVLMDIIYHLSRKKRSKVENWCYAKKQTLADMMGVSKRSIINLIKKLEKLELLTCSDDRKLVQTTDIWEKEVIEFNYEGEESSPQVKKVHSKESEESSQDVKKVHPKGEESSPPSNKDSNKLNKDNKEALLLLEEIEINKTKILDFCKNNPDQLTLITGNAMFRGDYREHIPSFVEHYMDTLNFREKPLRFFCQKFTTWLRNSKTFTPKRKKTTQPQTKNLVKQYQDHIQKYLTEKQRKSMNGQLLGYISKAEEKTVQGEISTLKSKLAHIKNPTFTDALVFDFCYASISTLSGSGTTPQKALSKFRQWYDKLSEYKQNKSDLRTDYKNFLIKYS